MQLDFHYYATYCAAYLAGYSHEESLRVAYSAQFVDCCSRTLLSKIGGPASAATTQLQLELMDASTDPVGLQDITRIWASFHFLPGDLYAERKHCSRRYLKKYRLICNTNSSLLVETVELARGKSLEAVGLAMHVLADTWAHRYFAGTPSLVINNTNHIFYELIPDGDGFTERQVKFNHNPASPDEPDKGIYDAMNKGIKMAKGEIVGIVNSDDWLDKDALLNVEQAAMLPDAMKKVYTGDIMYYYNDGSTQVIRYNQKDLAHYAKVWRLGLNHPATFVPHQLYDEYGLFDINIKLQADSDFIDRLYHNGVEFIFIEKVLSNQSDGGASTSNLNKSLKDYRYILNKNVESQAIRIFYYFKYWIAVQIKKHSPTFLLKIHRK